MAKVSIKKNDTVFVISGAERGKSGKVLRVDRKAGRVYVQGLNMQKKTVRRSQAKPQGGIMDVSEYDDGRGRIRVRARIKPDGDKNVVIREIPPTTTTEKLLESIEDAAKKGKIKIASIAKVRLQHLNPAF